jgi:hypothetical protein
MFEILRDSQLIDGGRREVRAGRVEELRVIFGLGHARRSNGCKIKRQARRSRDSLARTI